MEQFGPALGLFCCCPVLLLAVLVWWRAYYVQMIDKKQFKLGLLVGSVLFLVFPAVLVLSVLYDEFDEESIVSAVQARNYGRVESLLHLGYSPSAEDEFRNSPLSAAIENNDPKMVKLLLRYHLDPNRPITRAQKLPLRIADWEKKTEIAEILRQAGAHR